MPKSKHRKNQKQKSQARSKRIKEQQSAMRKKFETEFMKQIQELQNREMKIEEVEGEKSTDTETNN